jgi:ABC-2 type transport system ATP-binding protein
MLELQGLTKRFGELIALDGLSFCAAQGRMLGFVGPNGAGKTTAMRIVLGVLEPDAGSVRWRGDAIAAGTRARFGYMPEERGLYPKMKVRDQLTYFARLHGLDAAGASAAAARWIERLGLGERAHDRVETLSLGNQQRVQLAAALAHDPELLVLDEPFAGLDPAGVDLMSAVLRERADAGVPVVFSSHQLELVERLCEDVAIVNHGRIVAAGAVAGLREQGRGAAEQVRVRIEGNGDGAWVAGVPGAELAAADARGLLVRLSGDGRPDALLDAARAAGTVTYFSLERPSLTDLFRAAVAA